VDTDTVDRQFNALQQQAQQTGSLIAALAGKLSTAAAAGDPNAREWGLDLKEIALAIRDEQSTTTELLQAIHALIDNHVAAAAPPSAAARVLPGSRRVQPTAAVSAELPAAQPGRRRAAAFPRRTVRPGDRDRCRYRHGGRHRQLDLRSAVSLPDTGRLRV